MKNKQKIEKQKAKYILVFSEKVHLWNLKTQESTHTVYMLADMLSVGFI